MAEDSAAQEEETLRSWGTALAGRSRKDRQLAAHFMAVASSAVPQKVLPYVGVLVSAVSRPEAPTRWESLEALANLAPYAPDDVFAAFEGAENALYDEESALVRLNAFKFFVSLGSVGPDWSDRAWPLLREAIECLHGDPGFNDMLDGLVDFVGCDIDPSVRQAVVDCLAFDAQSGRGGISAHARRVIEAAHRQSGL